LHAGGDRFESDWLHHERVTVPKKNEKIKGIKTIKLRKVGKAKDVFGVLSKVH
jgi:hypothetical protein